MDPKNECKINEYLSVRLERKETRIYVGDVSLLILREFSSEIKGKKAK